MIEILHDYIPRSGAVLSRGDSGRDKNLKVWTYDQEFRTTWRRPNGTVIPLAVRSI